MYLPVGARPGPQSGLRSEPMPTWCEVAGLKVHLVADDSLFE
jgi:hypothetical protein